MAGIKDRGIPLGSKVFITLFAVFFGFLFIVGVVNTFSDNGIFGDSGDVAPADGFTIDSYKVVLNVSSDNVVDVTEEITVNWLDHGHHGIYKFTPEWLEYTPGDGKTIKRKASLSDYRAVGENYYVDTVKKKPRIRIGNADVTLPLGPYKYTIEYTYDMGRDPYRGYDEFIFHAFGDYWGTPINNASLEIHMPAGFDPGKISFWADKYRDSDITPEVDFHADGNTLYASVSGNYRLDKALTVDIELPDGYFTGGSNNYGFVSLAICLAIIGLAVSSFFRWLKYGKDYEKVAQTVEFYPPDGLDAAQVGYIYGKQTSKKLTVALVVQLAAKGYIQIIESADKRSRTIVNLRPRHGNNNNENVVAPLPELTEAEQIVYDALFSAVDSNDISLDASFYTVFGKIANSLEKGLKDKIDDRKAKSHMVRTAIWLGVGVVAYVVAWSVVEDMNPSFNALYALAFISLFATALFVFIMGRKTEYGETITARVRGFRNFVDKAERARIEMLAAENPGYYYHILPYAYVLNLSRKWVRHFENIPLPQTAMGNFDYSDLASFRSLSDSVHYPASSESSGGSSCGGGCSSCGGGCSSCGGGGSW